MSVLIVASSRTPAYEEAVVGVRKALNEGDLAPTVITLDSTSADGLLEHIRRRPAAVVAVGSAAVDAITSSEYEGPIIASMVLSVPPAAAAAAKLIATVTLDLPPGMVLQRLRALYPGRNRIAVMRGPGLSPATVREATDQARKLGYDIQIVECAGPKELLDSIGRLRRRVDFVWTFPDSRLYTGAVVSALILSGIRNGVPIVGFSAGMVQAGALVGFYPDYQDVGEQTGEAVVERLHGKRVTTQQHPRKVNATVNERVMRVLGMGLAPAAAVGLAILR